MKVKYVLLMELQPVLVNVEMVYWIQEKNVIKQNTAHLHVNQKQGTHVFQIIRALLLRSVEIVYWMKDKIVIQSHIAPHYAEQKLGTHVPTTVALTVGIVLYKLANNAIMGISQAVHLVKLSLLINVEVSC